MIVAGIEYLNTDAELFEDGSVHDATLSRNTMIQGLLWAGEHSVVYYPDGRLLLRWLAQATVIGPIECDKGIVRLFPDGSLMNATVTETQTIDRTQITAGEQVTLDASGRVLEYSTTLTADQQIHGLPFAAAFRVWRYASGRPSTGVLASPAIIANTGYPRGTELFLNRRGRVLRHYHFDLDSGEIYKQRLTGRFDLPFE